MSEFTILVDNREKQPYKFHRYPVETSLTQLTTGDYAVSGDGSSVSDKTWEPNYAIERKSGADFLGSITWERDRFENELARADSFSKRMPVIVEEPWAYFEDEQYRKNVNFGSIDATIKCHPEMFYMDYFFQRDRRKAEQLTYEFLKRRWQKTEDIV